MAIIDLTNSGARRSMTDPSRWRDRDVTARDPEEISQPRPVRTPDPIVEPEPAPIVETAPRIAEAASTARPADDMNDDNVDRSLRDRIRRISRRPQPDDTSAAVEAPRPRARKIADEERAELSEDSFSFTPAVARGREKSQRPPADREPGTIRQSARRRDEAPAPQVPARRAPTEPDVHVTGVHADESEIDMLRSEIDELRREMADMREAISRVDRPSPNTKGLGAVERTMQRLSERMDRIDGGAAPQISDGSGNSRPRKRGFLASLFG